MRDTKLLWAAIGILSVLLLLNIQGTIGPRSFPAQDKMVRADVFDRVNSSGTLRCAYIVHPPFCDKNSASGKLSGIFVDVVEELGRRLDLKIVWVEEVGIANMIEGLDRDRYDVVAFPIWQNASRGRRADFSTPMFYSVVGAYVRQDDHRFDNDLSRLNSPDVTIATIDGELAASIAAIDYPRAKTSGLPQLADYSQLLLEITSRKADVTFFDRTPARRFIAANPNAVRDISEARPIRVYPNSFVIKKGECRLKSMIDTAVKELLNNGVIQKLFVKNGENPSDYYFASPGISRGVGDHGSSP
jgi:polar amino acid transport system substrate-binding protein